MAGINHYHLTFQSINCSVVGTFADDQGIHLPIRRFLQNIAGRAGTGNNRPTIRPAAFVMWRHYDPGP